VREVVVLARVVDVQMRVQNPAHVLRLETVLRELCLEHLLLADPALHPEAVHDLRVGGARVDENRGVAAEDQVAEGRHPEANAHVLAEDEEARVELDVDQRQDFDLKTMDPSSSSPASANWEATFPPPTIHRFAVAA
jgi:hypothetical protein